MGNERRGLGLFSTAGLSVMLALFLAGTAEGQDIEIRGTVTSSDGDRLKGVAVRVQGTDVRTVTGRDGRYSIRAPADGVVIFSLIGYRALGLDIGGRTTVDVVMEQAIAVLGEVIVTGYTAQRRADITGAVSSVDIETVQRQTSASVLKRLDGQVPGVTVDASGSPGSRSTVRIRGVTSFQNNDPLYVIDGTPLQDTYLNWLNADDIASIQVLKDASAASIYGSRASNGVIIIETAKGRRGPPRVAVDLKAGVATPVRGYDDFVILDALEYHEIVKRSHENAGVPVPTRHIYGDPDDPRVPAYIYPNNGFTPTSDTLDPASYSYPNALIARGSPGTDWWDAVFGPARVSDVNLAVSGGGETSTYNVSFNYFDQEGTAAYNRFRRGGIRVNTELDVGRLRIGENLALSRDRQVGGVPFDPGFGREGPFVGRGMLSQPVIPVYDIKGNFAGPQAPGLCCGNPLKQAWADKDDPIQTTTVFGNVFAGIELLQRMSFTTRFGVDLWQTSERDYMPPSPEAKKPSFSTSLLEIWDEGRQWTWTNTLTYAATLGRHDIAVLVGHEAGEETSRRIIGRISDLVTTDLNARYIQDALGNPETKDVGSFGNTGALLSFFGKVDYDFADRYHLSFTLRRDGSSRLGPRNRWGTFPAIGAGWRVSREPFMAGSTFFTNMMLRFGWGVTGNQGIPTGRTVSHFGGTTADAFYDIRGTGSSIVRGFRVTSLGNRSLKWEENESVNVGLDLEFAGGKALLVVDVYERQADNLLFDPRTPATAGVAAPPIVNVGSMRNRGLEFSLGYGGSIGDELAWSVRLNGSHYKNEIVRIDGAQEFFFSPVGSRAGNPVINQVGHPIGSFYGLVADGFFADEAEVAAHAEQEGAAPGRIRFKDLDGDGLISADDRTIIGDPHPDFTAGLDLGVRWGAWDLNVALFGTFGNDVFDTQKIFYVFRLFGANVRRDLLTHSAVVENGRVVNIKEARYPRLDVNDTFSPQLSSFYIEDGSYVRLRTLRSGYRVPASFLPGLRVYVQAENLFTITGYSGLDPELPAANVRGPAGDIRDQGRGLDRGTYASSRTISLGVSARFSVTP